MKRWLPWVLMCLLFTACGKTEHSPAMKEALTFRTSLMESGGCQFQAKVLADYGDRVYEFELSCSYDAEKGASVTVLSPEEIAGIGAEISSEGGQITFEDLHLELGQMAGGHVSPVALPWTLGSSWTGAYIESAAQDDQLVLVTFLLGYDDEEVMVETWLDVNGVPIRCDLSYSGARCLAAEITDFEFL